GNFTYFNSVDDGITTAYSNGPTISQTVGATVQAGILYTLMVDLGSRKDIGPHASAALIVNGNTYTATGSFVAGGWNTFTATYLGTSTDAGSSITIALLSSGPQANFDNVRLSDSTTVPEPATLAFLGLGLAAGAIFRRAKSARQ
ncbi:MAG: hypothetical protein JWP63_5033, partial [Candidatus Solibacter sp.]|nr:hypothetical protein [Candidatus Solibacter sp.]